MMNNSNQTSPETCTGFFSTAKARCVSKGEHPNNWRYRRPWTPHEHGPISLGELILWRYCHVGKRPILGVATALGLKPIHGKPPVVSSQ